MIYSLAILSVYGAFGTASVETKLCQVHPNVAQEAMRRSPQQKRAVVLIHGLDVRFETALVSRPVLQDWQKPDCLTVKTLARDGDVFAFAYGQNTRLEDVTGSLGLRFGMQHIKNLGYDEIVLVGHSAGGLIARHFVEDYPDDGVTKVIQVLSPNGGCALAVFSWCVNGRQKSFVDSLSPRGRASCLANRSGKKIPMNVDFVTVVSTCHQGGDGLISGPFQWSTDLQAQGIPAIAISAKHREAMAHPDSLRVLTRQMQIRSQRWNPGQVAVGRQQFFQP